MVRVSSKNAPRSRAQMPYSSAAYWKARAGGGALCPPISPALVAGVDALFKDYPLSCYGGREADPCSRQVTRIRLWEVSRLSSSLGMQSPVCDSAPAS